MDYIYEAELEQVEGDWLCTVPKFEGAFGGGATVRKAVGNCAEALRLAIAEALDEGAPLPRATFHNPPRVVMCVEVGEHYVRESAYMTVKQAAEELGVTSGRVSQLLKAGQLEAVTVGGRRMVTIASVNDRLSNPPAPHRPKAE